MSVNKELYRALSGSFPTGVLIVATLDENEVPKGLLTQAYIGVSTEPPLMLVAIDKTSRTLPAIQHRRAFVINFLREGSEDLATLFASKADDKFRDVRWRPSPEAGGSPILPDVSVAYAACRVTDAREAGDHWLFGASVDAGEVFGGTPLIYYRRKYVGWPEEKPAPPVEGTG